MVWSCSICRWCALDVAHAPFCPLPTLLAASSRTLGQGALQTRFMALSLRLFGVQDYLGLTVCSESRRLIYDTAAEPVRRI